jgi:hypothetical protein
MTVVGGVVAPDAASTLSFGGGLAMLKNGATTSTLKVDVTGTGGVAGVDAGTVAVGGTLALGSGDADVAVTFGRNVVPGVNFLGTNNPGPAAISLATAANVTGSVATASNAVTLVTTNGPLAFWKISASDVAISGDSKSLNLSLTVANWKAMKGDANLDGQVSLADLQALALYWNKSAANWTQADFNLDGQVSLSDLQDLAANWNKTWVASSEAPAVPEPATLTLLAVGGLLALRRRRIA